MTHAAPLSVLVADEDDGSRNRLSNLLADSGFAPIPARTGREAVEVVRSRVVAVSVLDVMLPDLTGLETFQLISSVRGGVPGIFLARERSKETLVRLLKAGAYTVLQKPPLVEVFLDAMRRLTARIRGNEDQVF